MRNSKIQVGDLIQYRFVGGLDTRRVLAVIDHGAAFRVAGNYRIDAAKITTHIPAQRREDQSAGYGFCGTGRS